MHSIVLSHPLYKPGMDALVGKADLIIPNDGDSDRILEQLKKADGFILRIGKIDRKAIEACPNLRVITRPGVGVDNVDVAAATEKGIPVVICPSANSRAVAEHTVALMFALAKNLIESDNETRKGNFGIRNKYAAIELADKTLSVIGFGNIGKIVARLCASIGMKIVAYDPFIEKKAVEVLGYHHVETIEEAVALGDFVTLHMPSFLETKNLMNEALIALMKPTAFLVNCARGDIVDEAALLKALADKRISGAGVDVLSAEPMKAENPIMKLANLIVTPHMAAQTQESTAAVVRMAVEGTLAVLDGVKWPNVCNPQAYDHPRWVE